MRWRLTDVGLQSDSGDVVGPPPPEDVMAWLYLRLKQDGLLARVFYQSVPTLRQYLDWYCGEGKGVIGAWGGGGDLKGIGFINAVERSPGLAKCEVGFSFLAGISPFAQIGYMRAMISFLFLSSDIGCILGTTPEKNRSAVAMVKRLGMRTVEVPMYCIWEGEPCSAVISQTDRQHWFNGPGRDFAPQP